MIIFSSTYARPAHTYTSPADLYRDLVSPPQTSLKKKVPPAVPKKTVTIAAAAPRVHAIPAER